MYKFNAEKKLMIFLVHPGGPFWKDKDAGAWSIPKGESDDGEGEFFDSAKREFFEETGIKPPEEKEKYFSLGETKLKSGKIVHAWAFEGDWSGLLMCSSYVDIEWPPKSGKFVKIPEVDRAGFFDIEKAKEKMDEGQKIFLERLIEIISGK